MISDVDKVSIHYVKFFDKSLEVGTWKNTVVIPRAFPGSSRSASIAKLPRQATRAVFVLHEQKVNPLHIGLINYTTEMVRSVK